MNSPVRYADLLRLLGELGFDCGTVRGGVRVCEHKSSETLIVFADRPADEAIRAQILVGVQLQLEARGLLARDEFERRVALGGKLGEGNGAGRPRKACSRVSGGSG